MDPLLYRASGHDFANLWMNMTKIVIALAFIYQNALGTQLGVRLFQDYYYIFHVPVRTESDEAGPGFAEVVTPEEPYFSIDFKPLALGQAYEELAVEVVGLWSPDGEDILAASPERRGSCPQDTNTCVRFTWAELTGGDRTILHRATFNLLNIVRGETALGTGDYEVEFGFWFLREGAPLADRSSSKVHRGSLKFLRQEEQRFGDFPVVQGRPIRLPALILQHIRAGGSWGGWSSWRETRAGERAQDGGWRNGSVLTEDFQRGWLTPSRSLNPGRSFEQRGYYFDEQNLRLDFTIGFILLRNEPPRSTYLGPGESDIHFVRIFYEWHFFEEDRGYFYYNLSRHIIDPDGTTAPIDGRPDVRVREFADLQPQSLPYSLQRDSLTGDWHLRVQGSIERSLAVGSYHDLSVIARDDFQSQRIRIRIER
jgi:hypothetical protein